MGWFKKTKDKNICDKINKLKTDIEDFTKMSEDIAKLTNCVEYDNRVHFLKYRNTWIPVDGKYLCDILEYSMGTCKEMIMQFGEDIVKVEKDIN